MYWSIIKDQEMKHISFNNVPLSIFPFPSLLFGKVMSWSSAVSNSNTRYIVHVKIQVLLNLTFIIMIVVLEICSPIKITAPSNVCNIHNHIYINIDSSYFDFYHFQFTVCNILQFYISFLCVRQLWTYFIILYTSLIFFY